MAEYFVGGQTVGNETVSNLGITNSFLATTLAENWTTFKGMLEQGKIESISAARIPPDPIIKKTYLQHRVRFVFANGQSLSVIIKTPHNANTMDELRCSGPSCGVEPPSAAEDEHVAAYLQSLIRGHDLEANFIQRFAHIVPMLESYFIRKTDDAGGLPPLLIIEDCAEKAAEMDYKQAPSAKLVLESIVTHLGKFHAHLLCSDDWKREFPAVSFVHEKEKKMWEDSAMRSKVEAGLHVLRAKGEGHSFDRPFQRMQKLVDPAFKEFAQKTFPRSIGLPGVLPIGGLSFPYDVLISKAKSPADAVFYAFATSSFVSVTPLVHDLARVLMIVSHKNVEQADALLQLYYDTLVEQMRENGSGRTPDFTLETLKRGVHVYATAAIVDMLKGLAAACDFLTEDNIIEAQKGLSLPNFNYAIETLEKYAPEWLEKP